MDIYSITSRYGITPDQYVLMMESQNYSCAICGKKFGTSTQMDGPCVDHDHTTGVVRGLLCRRCNMGIGFFENNLDNIINAYIYLEEANEKACVNTKDRMEETD